MRPRILTLGGAALLLAVAFHVAGDDDQSGKVDDYNQWKQALGTQAVTDPATMAVPQGFVVDLVRAAGPDEGSWISLEFDPRGRLLIAREDRGIYRLSLKANEASSNRPAEPAPLERIDDQLLECRGLLWAHDALYVNANNSKGFYRMPYQADTDQFGAPELLYETAGGVGHGRNDLALGPDGWIYSIHGDDVRLPSNVAPSKSPLQNYSEARVVPCAWDEQLFNASMTLPGGHLVRTDREGRHCEVVAGGLRNPYGIDFSPDGELFTFDADMEWDVGMPWYRPTRVLHLVSGADFGWRKGTGTWRAWFPDSLPAAADVGLGSPTAVKFGTRTHFPKEYREALFITDWAYGRILAVTLRPDGATYQGEVRPFVSGRPLNVTDLAVGPDGAMYFLTGGRKTQSALYRVRHKSPSSVDAQASPAAPNTQAAAAREKRKQLESLHTVASPEALEAGWSELGNADLWIRHAARVVVERQPVSSWRERAFAASLTSADAGSLASLTSLLALSRVGEPNDLQPLSEALMRVDWATTPAPQRLLMLRALSTTVARLGPLESELRQRMAAYLEPHYPSDSSEFNQMLCELLVALESEVVVERTLPLILTAKSQEEKFHYLVTLREFRHGWNDARRREYLAYVRQASDFYGAQYLPKYLTWLRDDIAAALSPEDKDRWQKELAPPEPPSLPATIAARPHVRNWQMDDLVGSIGDTTRPVDLGRGEATFKTALCDRCHRLGGRGSPIGPELTQVARRFGRADMLLSILVPAHVVDEKYRFETIVTTDGRVVAGQVTAASDRTLTILADPLQPQQAVTLQEQDIESRTPTLVSPMPAGLLNTFTKEEILDLLAYLETAAAK